LIRRGKKKGGKGEKRGWLFRSWGWGVDGWWDVEVGNYVFSIDVYIKELPFL